MIENTEKMKEWIDNASYFTLLERWRMSPSGDPIFQGEMGKYYAEVMNKKKPSGDDHSRISKIIGWE